jgi:hypothetical protein
MARGKTDPPGQAEKEPGEPGARDGEPNADELARRRAAKGESASAGSTGTSVSERVAAGEEDGELFSAGSLEGDSKVTMKNLIKPGAKVTVKASMSSAEVPLTTGLLDPEEEVELLVRGLPGGPVPVAKHRDASAGGDHKIEEWTLRQPVRVIHVQAAGEMYTREQVLEFFHAAGVPDATVSKLLGDEPQAANA